MKLANKILLLFFIITVLFSGSGAYFVFFNLTSALKKEIGKQQLLATNQLMEEIDVFLYERIQDIKTISQASVIIEGIATGEISSYEKARQRVDQFFYTTGPWDQLMIIDKQGKVELCTLGAKNENIVEMPAIYAAFQAALKGETYYSDVVVSLETDRPTMVFSAPVRNSADIRNPIIGAVVGELSWPAIKEYLEKIQEPILVRLYNKDGIIIGTNKKEYKTETPTVNGGFNSLSTSVSEQGYLSYKGNNWILLLETPASVVFASAITSAWKVGLFVAALGIAVMFFLYFLIIKIFISPVLEISSAMKKRTEGDTSLRLKIKSKDETGQMCSVFNEMADKLNDLYRNLEEKVRLRTEELSQKNEKLQETQKAMVNLLEDLNDEKNALAQKQAQDEAILTGIGDGVFVIDTDGRIILFNPIAEKISGFTAKEAIGKEYNEILKFIFEKDGTINDKFIKEAIIKDRITQMANHTLLVRKDGASVPVADSAAPIKDVNGKIFGCVVVFRDVTKEREIDKMKTEFISVASHQLRTPLTGIKWFSELLLKSKLNAVTKDYIRQIFISNERMVRLVDDLLNVSRIEAGKNFDIVLENTDIVPLMKSVLKEQAPSAEKKHITLVCAKDAPQKLIMSVDGLKIRQVFQNLISNAIKYSKEKTEITAGCNKNKDAVVFYIKDNGIGIPQRQQGQIFSKFFRAENALTMQTDGTGLGLYIVKAIVEGHGGKIWFESTENKGTTFYVSLPIKLIK